MSRVLPGSPSFSSRSLSWLVATLLLMPGAVTYAGEQADSPSVHVPRFSGPIAVDGKLREKCWGDAARVALSDPWKQNGLPLEPTEVLILSTDQALYIAFLAQDSEILATRTQRDTETHLDDCVEFFMDRSSNALDECLGLETNALGTVADFYYRQGSVDYGWQPDTVRIKAVREGSFALGKTAKGPGFVVEEEIPWKELLAALPAKEIPARLRVNFGRWNYGRKGSIFSIWSDPQTAQPGPYRMDRFGWLIFDQRAKY